MQLKVEGSADALAERHTPRPVDSGAEGSVDDQLHPSAFVEEPLGHHPVGGRDNAQDALPFDQVGHQLPGNFGRDSGFGCDPGFRLGRVLQKPVHGFPQLGNLLGKLPGSARGLAQPERNGRWLALRVLNPHPAAFDAADFPGRVSQQEDVAGHAFNGEILVDGADEGSVRICYHLVIGVVGNGPSAGQGRDASSPSALDPVVDAVTVQVGPAASLPGGEPLGQRLNHLVEPIPGQVTVRVGPAAQVEQGVLVPVLSGAGGHHLLGHNIQRPGRNGEGVQVAPHQRAGQGGAFQQFVPGQREQLPPWGAPDGMTGPAHALHEQPDGSGRADLAYQVYVPDVYAQLQRRRGHANPHLAVLQFLFGVQPGRAGQTAVVGDHGLFAEAGG